MSNYRGLIWSIVAIAGTATAATLAYRYVTRSARPLDGDDDSDVEDAAATGGSRSTRRSRQNASHQREQQQQVMDDDEEAVEWVSDSEDGDAVGVDERVQSQQQMVLVAREGNLVRACGGIWNVWSQFTHLLTV